MDLILLKHQWSAYARTNWLKIVIFGILCFIILKRDFSFQLNLNAPGNVREAVEPARPQEQPVQPYLKSTAPEPTSQKGQLTEKQVVTPVAVTPEPATHKSGLLDNFKPFSHDSESTVAPMPELPVTAPAPVTYQFTGEMDEWMINTYIERFGHVAINEQRKFNIPASIILANGLFHSFAGQRELAIKSNNHFGLKCQHWNGATVQKRGTCYRQYDSAWESFRDHSQYLTQGRFAQLQQYAITDYQSWAKGLEQLGFANQPKLSQEIIKLIEEYRLYRYDLDGI